MLIAKLFLVPTLCAALAMSSASDAYAARKNAAGRAKKPVAASKTHVKSKSKKTKKAAPVMMSKKITLKPAAIRKFKHRKHKAKHG